MMCGSQCLGVLRNEFRVKNLKANDIHPARLAYLQWRLPIGVVLVYRILVALYCLSWLLYTSQSPDFLINGVNVNQYAFLTVWTYLIMTVYFMLHCLVCLIFICDQGTSPCQAPSRENHRQLFKELDMYSSLWGSQGYSFIPDSEYEEEADMENSSFMMRRLKKFVWIFYNISSVACIMVTIIFWSLLYPSMEISGIDAIVNFQVHGVTSILIFIETLVTAVPVRLVHMIYTLLYGLAYVIFSGIYYSIDNRIILYPDVLDWSQPGRTVVVIVITALVVLPLIQLFLFSIYRLRLWIYCKCNA